MNNPNTNWNQQYGPPPGYPQQGPPPGYAAGYQGPPPGYPQGPPPGYAAGYQGPPQGGHPQQAPAHAAPEGRDWNSWKAPKASAGASAENKVEDPLGWNGVDWRSVRYSSGKRDDENPVPVGTWPALTSYVEYKDDTDKEGNVADTPVLKVDVFMLTGAGPRKMGLWLRPRHETRWAAFVKGVAPELVDRDLPSGPWWAKGRLFYAVVGYGSGKYAADGEAAKIDLQRFLPYTQEGPPPPPPPANGRGRQGPPPGYPQQGQPQCQQGGYGQPQGQPQYQQGPPPGYPQQGPPPGYPQQGPPPGYPQQGPPQGWQAPAQQQPWQAPQQPPQQGQVYTPPGRTYGNAPSQLAQAMGVDEGSLPF